MIEIKNEDIERLNKIEKLSSGKRKAYVLNVYYYAKFASPDKRICCELYDVEKRCAIESKYLSIGEIYDQSRMVPSNEQLYEIFKENADNFFNKILKRHFVFLDMSLRWPLTEVNCFFYLPIEHGFNNEFFKKFELLLNNIKKDIKNMEHSNDGSQ